MLASSLRRTSARSAFIAERGFAAATLGEPRWLVLLTLAIGWAFALWLLGLRVAREPGADRPLSSALPGNST